MYYGGTYAWHMDCTLEKVTQYKDSVEKEESSGAGDETHRGNTGQGDSRHTARLGGDRPHWINRTNRKGQNRHPVLTDMKPA